MFTFSSGLIIQISEVAKPPNVGQALCQPLHSADCLREVSEIGCSIGRPMLEYKSGSSPTMKKKLPCLVHQHNRQTISCNIVVVEGIPCLAGPVFRGRHAMEHLEIAFERRVIHSTCVADGLECPLRILLHQLDGVVDTLSIDILGEVGRTAKLTHDGCEAVAANGDYVAEHFARQVVPGEEFFLLNDIIELDKKLKVDGINVRYQSIIP